MSMIIMNLVVFSKSCNIMLWYSAAKIELIAHSVHLKILVARAISW